MARHFHLEVDLDALEEPGVVTALMHLRIRGVTVLEFLPTGLNGSALAFARAATDGHRVDDGWPLFFCPFALTDRCGVTSDFAVTLRGNDVELSDFHGCKVAPDARFVVPWGAFAAAAVRVGDLVVRRSRTPDPAMRAEDSALRTVWREELRERLRPIRARRRALEHHTP